MRLSRRRRAPGQDVAIVLGGGGGPQTDNKPSKVTVLRAKTAAELAKARPRLTIICSGDGRACLDMENCLTEAEHLAQFLIGSGVARRRLFLEKESVDTMGNAILSYARFLYLQKPGKLTLITSPFHAERAERTFRGVFDPAWQIDVLVCPPAADDAKRRAADDGGKGWTANFLKGIQPGDLPALSARLQAIGKPFYRQHKLLTALARNREDGRQ